jgi:hypothetical protein
MYKRDIVVDNSFLQSTFKISYSGSSGTCFQYIHLIGTVGNVFLVTVRHLFPMVLHGQGVTFNIATNNGTTQITGIIYFPPNINGMQVDMALIKIQDPLCPYYKFDREDYMIGQDAFFTGFPLGLHMQSVGINNGFPLPIVKKGMISAYSTAFRQWSFDGHNNRGFSGSPIGYHDLQQKKSFIIGVVCAYYPQQNTMTIAGADYTYTENAGLFIANDFQHALNLFHMLDTQNLLDKTPTSVA